MGRLFEAWLEWPIPARWLSGVTAFWIISALAPAFYSSNPAATFGEYFVGLGIHYGLMVGGIALGIWIGKILYSRTESAWISWGVGIGVFIFFGFLRIPLGEFFGVSDVLEKLLDSDCYTDWDGRSNPTVCE